MSGVQKISRFNRERFGRSTNESDYPTLTERQAFVGAMAARSAAEIAEMTVQPDLPVIAHAALNPADLERRSDTLRRLLASALRTAQNPVVEAAR